jgi:hypothetical protein
MGKGGPSAEAKTEESAILLLARNHLTPEFLTPSQLHDHHSDSTDLYIIVSA